MQPHKLFLLAILLLATGLSGCGEAENSGGSGDPTDPDPGDDVDPDPSDFPSTGVPDQNSFTLVADVFNPRARNVANTNVNVTVLLADQLNNNVTIPDGTQIFLATEGGSVQSTCATEGGQCSVTWTSQLPVPAAGPAIDDPLGSGEQVVSYSSGRATILAWAFGSESFIDNNSNGLFDDGDVQVLDNPEVFLDKNENGVRDVDEEFVNYPNPDIGFSGTYDLADGLYSGPNCAHSSLCANDQSVFIFDNIELAMSSEGVCIVDVGPLVNPGGGAPFYYPSTTHAATSLTTGMTFTFRFLLHDCFGNPPMSGTTLSFSTDGAGELLGPTDFTIPNTNIDMGTTDTGATRQRYPSGSLVYSATVVGDPANTDPELGRLDLTVELPNGNPGYAAVDLTDPAM